MMVQVWTTKKVWPFPEKQRQNIFSADHTYTIVVFQKHQKEKMNICSFVVLFSVSQGSKFIQFLQGRVQKLQVEGWVWLLERSNYLLITHRAVNIFNDPLSFLKYVIHFNTYAADC